MDVRVGHDTVRSCRIACRIGTIPFDPQAKSAVDTASHPAIDPRPVRFGGCALGIQPRAIGRGGVSDRAGLRPRCTRQCQNDAKGQNGDEDMHFA